MSELRQLHIHRLDPAIKERLIEEADARDLSIHGLAVSILCERYGMNFTSSGRSGREASPDGGQLQLVVSQQLYKRISDAADRQPKGRRFKYCVVEDIFREYFDAVDAAAVA
jgi:hypothetical protein